MNKLFLVFLFTIFISYANGQDSLAIAKKTNSKTQKLTEEDLKIDTSAIVIKSFEKNYKKKYTGSAFIYEYKTQKSTFWSRFKEWLNSKFLDLFKISDPETPFSIIKIIAILIVIFVVYLLVKLLINKEGSWIFGSNANKKKIVYTEIEKNIHLVDFEKLINECIAENNKRLCIRYYYLWLLKVMAENHFIDWHVDKTNSDYLYELHGLKLKNTFSYVSYLYNYIWYGEFDLDQTTFEIAQAKFKEALKTFSNE